MSERRTRVNRFEAAAIRFLLGPVARIVFTPWLWAACSGVAIATAIFLWRAEQQGSFALAVIAAIEFGVFSYVSWWVLRTWRRTDRLAKESAEFND